MNFFGDLEGDPFITLGRLRIILNDEFRTPEKIVKDAKKVLAEYKKESDKKKKAGQVFYLGVSP